MTLTRITRKKVPDPLQDWIDRTLASKRLRAKTSQRAETEPVGKVEAVGSAYAGVWKSLAKFIGVEVRL